MTRPAPLDAGPSPLGHAALWSGAALLVLTAHAGAVAWMLREPLPAAEASPPAAIMIELAAEAEAVATEEDMISPDQMDSEEIRSDTTKPVEDILPEDAPPEDTPPEEVPPEETPPVEPPVDEPVETPPEPVVETPPEEPIEPEPEPEPIDPEPEAEVVEEIDPLERQMIAALDSVTLPVPVARPNPPPVRRAERPAPEAEPERRPRRDRAEPERAERRRPPAAAAAQKAQAEVRQSNRTAARQTSSGAASPLISPARWQSRLMAHLERRKRFPRGALRRGEVAVAHVRFRIDDGGNVLSASLARSSGVAAIDEAAVAMVQRSSPVPAPPAGANRSVTAPVRFSGR